MTWKIIKRVALIVALVAASTAARAAEDLGAELLGVATYASKRCPNVIVNLPGMAAVIQGEGQDMAHLQKRETQLRAQLLAGLLDSKAKAGSNVCKELLDRFGEDGSDYQDLLIDVRGK